MTKTVIETALDKEMSNHLGYDKHELVGCNRRNSRNGKRSKTLLTLGAQTPDASPTTGMSCWLLMIPSLRFSVGVQLGWSTTVWGFQSGKVIDECEYLQARDSNKCPEGDLNLKAVSVCTDDIAVVTFNATLAGYAATFGPIAYPQN